MQTVKVNLNKPTQEQIDLIIDYLKRGQVIAYPTDTIYGLGCDARKSQAVKKIREIKGKGDKTPMLILISDFSMLKRYCVVNEDQEEYLRKVWPGKVTAILTLAKARQKYNLPNELAAGLDTLAVRLPKSEFLTKMISAAGFPIVSTSLNKTGEPPLSNAQNLEKYFEILPDLAIDGGECESSKPSRLVDLREVENVKVIRE